MPVPGRDAPRCKWSVLRCFTSRGAAGARCPAYRKASCEERGGRRWWSGGVRCKRRTGPRGMEETRRGRHERNWRTLKVATNSCCGTPNPAQRIHISGNLRRHNLKPLPWGRFSRQPRFRPSSADEPGRRHAVLTRGEHMMNGHLKSNKTYQIWMLWVECLIFLLSLPDLR